MKKQLALIYMGRDLGNAQTQKITLREIFAMIDMNAQKYGFNYEKEMHI